jgi:sphinganine-1-phosphate aldolase
MAAHERFFMENALNPMAFKSLKRMEAEVVQMTASMLHAPPDAVGTMTSGGTESLLMAVKTYRERARAKRPWVRSPEMVAPDTIHVAIDKAAHYFGVKLRRARPSTPTGASTWPTCASRQPQHRAPPRVGAPVPARRRRPHRGGRRARRGARASPSTSTRASGASCSRGSSAWGTREPFDFRVAGVTSMSADLHKYGLAAKGASTIVYRDMSYLKHQFFVATELARAASTPRRRMGHAPRRAHRRGVGCAAAMGEDGFVEHTRARCSREAPARGRRGDPGARGARPAPRRDHRDLQGPRPRDVDIYAVADRLEDARLVSADRQQKPACMHCTVTSNHAHIDDYLATSRGGRFVKRAPRARPRATRRCTA